MEARLDLKLDTLTFKLDSEPQIVIQKELCPACEGRPCTIACPAQLFVWVDDQMTFNCDGCLECGSCRVVCPTVLSPGATRAGDMACATVGVGTDGELNSKTISEVLRQLLLKTAFHQQ